MWFCSYYILLHYISEGNCFLLHYNYLTALGTLQAKIKMFAYLWYVVINSTTNQYKNSSEMIDWQKIKYNVFTYIYFFTSNIFSAGLVVSHVFL